MSTVDRKPRFVVRDLGSGEGDRRRTPEFVVHDTVTQLSYDPFFTRQAAQRAVDLRNRRAAR